MKVCWSCDERRQVRDEDCDVRHRHDLVTISKLGRELHRLPDQSRGRCDSLVSGFEGLSSQFAMFACGDQVAACVEVVIEDCMNRKEALGRSGCSETLHLAFS